MQRLTVQTKVMRKRESLPRFVVVRADKLRGWNLQPKTQSMMTTVNGVDLGRRSLRWWDENRWFIQLDDTACLQAGVDTGSDVTVTLIPATKLPAELQKILDANRTAQANWERMSESEQRMFADYVAEGARPETRLRRSRRILGD